MYNYPDPTEDYNEVSEPTLHDLFHEYEDMPEEAINYVAQLEEKIRFAKEELQLFHDSLKVNGHGMCSRMMRLIKKLKK